MYLLQKNRTTASRYGKIVTATAYISGKYTFLHIITVAEITCVIFINARLVLFLNNAHSYIKKFSNVGGNLVVLDGCHHTIYVGLNGQLEFWPEYPLSVLLILMTKCVSAFTLSTIMTKPIIFLYKEEFISHFTECS